MIRVTPHISLDESELQFSYVRASGPGGQHVNKVATAAQLRFNVDASPALSGAVRNRLKQLAGRRITTEGELLITAQRYRSQERNRADAIDRLVQMIREAATPPKPRKKTRRTRASVERRLGAKKRRGEAKKNRRRPGAD